LASDGGIARVLSQIVGELVEIREEDIALRVGAFQVDVLIPDFVRRRLQARAGDRVTLHTIFDIEGNQMSGRMRPRLIGFLLPVEREFFEVFCSVDGVGVRKALRAMVRPVRELARHIQDQDVATLATFPGIGEAMAERIVAKLRRKVGKFALMVESAPREAAGATVESNGDDPRAEPDTIRDAYAALLSVGHTESQARQLIDDALSTRKRFKSVADMIETIYERSR
jgi:Holliday junction DNA helicase RuvA